MDDWHGRGDHRNAFAALLRPSWGRSGGAARALLCAGRVLTESRARRSWRWAACLRRDACRSALCRSSCPRGVSSSCCARRLDPRLSLFDYRVVLGCATAGAGEQGGTDHGHTARVARLSGVAPSASVSFWPDWRPGAWGIHTWSAVERFCVRGALRCDRDSDRSTSPASGLPRALLIALQKSSLRRF